MMEVKESVYEEMCTWDNNSIPQKNEKIFTKSITMKDSPSKQRREIEDIEESDYEKYVEVVKHDEAEDIYEVIPADFAPTIYTTEMLSRSSSVSSDGSDCIRRNSSRKKKDVTPSSSPKTNTFCTPDTEYAEIHSPKITEIVPSRPTRESENPILRQDFAQLTENYCSVIPQLKIIRETLTWLSNTKVKSKPTQNGIEKSTSPQLLRRSLSSGDARNGILHNANVVLYENSPAASPHSSPSQSPLQKHSKTPVYENVEFPLMESDRESQYSTTSSSSTEGHGVSLEDKTFVNLYENVENCMQNDDNAPRKRTKSQPIDIVYSDLQFPNEKVEAYLSSSIDAAVMARQEGIQERSRSLSPNTKPSPRGNGLSRPKSLSLRRLASGSLGLHLARFVKKVTVQRSNDTTLQATMCEILSSSKNHDDDDSSVNVEVNSDLMRISTNYPPWEVIASFDIESIGHANLYEEDESVLGVIVCPPKQEAICYVVKCQGAKTIFRTIKKAFKAPNLRSYHLSSPTQPDPFAQPGDEDFTSIPHIMYLGCVKVKTSYLVINDSISTLLEKLNPKDFKSITLKIRPEEILIVDEETEKTLHHHLIAWVLSLGVFSDDSRLFGYIVTEARQDEKTRMYCHAFRCGRVTGSVTATETIRLACQATYCPGRKDSVKSRRNSQRSTHSSVSSHSTSSLQQTILSVSVNELPTEPEKSSTDPKPVKHKYKRSFSSKEILRKLSSKSKPKAKSSFRSYMSEPDLSKSFSTSSSSSLEEIPAQEETIEPPPEIEEEREYSFRVAYLCSTIINPPLRPKHVRDCVKQYQKELAKVLKRTGVTPPVKQVSLNLSADGVTMVDAQQPQVGQRFFPFPCVNRVKGNKDFPEYFAFSTVVTGNTKHKCHLFRQVKEPCEDIMTAFEYFLWEKV